LGLGYKKNGKIILNPVHCSFEMPHYRDLPYHLVEITSENYNRLANGEVILPIFTAMGCPYKCTFCMAPAVYEKIKGKKWSSYSNELVLEHIEYLMEKYEFQRLQIYDDDSFVDLDKLHELLTEYIKKGFNRKFKLDFRGARVNELDKMDDDFYRLMVQANVELLAIGAESGSNRSLKKMKKGITVEQTIRVNQRFAKYPSLKPHYNFFSGIPGETIEDLIKTKELVLRLVKDNPNCYLGVGADWKPLPGSEMTDDAVRHYGLKLPKSLADWAAVDSFDAKKIVHPWYTKEIDNMIRLLQIAGQLLDKKIRDYRKDMGLVLGNLVYFAAILYRPILLFRLRFNFTALLLEARLLRLFFRYLGKLFAPKKN
jgi:radical SAM superfamily enzyme YgiQ (UPF0313 family)